MTKPNSFLTLFFWSTIFLAIANSQVVETDKGKVEYIGLKRWSIKMIEDSLPVCAPKGHGLWGCAAGFKTHLHFADASVERYLEGDSVYTVITVVEPQDSVRVQYKPEPLGSTSILADYQIAAPIMQKENMTFQIAMTTYSLLMHGEPDSAKSVLREWGADTLRVREIWQFLASKKDQGSKALAVWTALHNPNETNRAIAAAILLNHPEDDMTWWTLMEVLRDRKAIVGGTAIQSLNGLLDSLSKIVKSVDWTPCVQTLRFLLTGTDLFAHTTVLKVLQRTKISPTLAPALLDEQTTDLLFAYLQAQHAEERQLAHGLLVQLSGMDFCYDPQAWQRWIEGIKGKK